MSQSYEVTKFLGMGFHCETLESATRVILERDNGSPFCYIVTPNVQHVVKVAEDSANLGPLYKHAWRVYCDSRVLSRLARFCGRRLPVITGSDLTAELLKLANQLSLKIAVIGPSQEDCTKIAARYPHLAIACHTPPMGFIERETEIAKCIGFVERERAPLVFLALGMPRQEILAGRLLEAKTITGIGLCVGASIDFLIGKQRRAPLWVQKIGFEWLHRLLLDPRRLASRYFFDCPKIFILTLRELWRGG